MKQRLIGSCRQASLCINLHSFDKPEKRPEARQATIQPKEVQNNTRIAKESRSKSPQYT